MRVPLNLVKISAGSRFERENPQTSTDYEVARPIAFLQGRDVHTFIEAGHYKREL
jgi:hypothetical protein